MATKKTTKRATPKKATRKKTDVDAVAADAPIATAKPARRGARRAAGPKAAEATPVSAAIAATANVAAPAPAVEEVGEKLVIRFSPVAPTPFPPIPAAAKPVEETPPAAEFDRNGDTHWIDEPIAVEGERGDERSGARPPLVTRQREERAGDVSSEERGEGESRRRRRRRRRGGRGGENADGGGRDGEARQQPETRRDVEARPQAEPRRDAADGRGRFVDRWERPVSEVGSAENVRPARPAEEPRREATEGEGDDRTGRRRRRRRRGGRRPTEELEVSGPGVEPADRTVAEEEMFAEVAAEKYDDEDEGDVSIGAAPEPDPADEDPRWRRRGRRPRIREPREMIDVETAAEEAPAVEKKMVINVVPRDECRVALLGNNRLEEIYIERASSENYVGNIYKGVVTNVEASIQAAFVDFGAGKNGFLHISDLHPEYFGNGGDTKESVGRKTPRRHRPPIQSCLRRGQEVIVQITKEGIGTKGPTLTTYLSIPGRYLVMTSSMEGIGVSRKIEDDDQRRKLRRQLDELELIPEVGFIARTAALGRTNQELQADLNYLARLWKVVEKRRKSERAPAELYRESDLVIRTIRDVFTADVKSLVVDDPDVARRAQEFLSVFRPDAAELVSVYDGPEPIFHKYGIEQELERLHARHVPLKSGGSLVIDQTEALVAIDVNSGKFRTEDDAETTAFKMNLEAADEIPRQLRLRDLGGVVICDFIDMRDLKHRREIERRLVRNLKAHKERAKILRMSSFGIIEMTRQRQRASLTRNVYSECKHCRGTGLVKTAEAVALDVVRILQLAATREAIARIEVLVSLDVANLLLNRKRRMLADLEAEQRCAIIVHPEPNYGLDHVEIRCTDARGRLVPHA